VVNAQALGLSHLGHPSDGVAPQVSGVPAGTPDTATSTNAQDSTSTPSTSASSASQTGSPADPATAALGDAQGAVQGVHGADGTSSPVTAATSAAGGTDPQLGNTTASHGARDAASTASTASTATPANHAVKTTRSVRSAGVMKAAPRLTVVHYERSTKGSAHHSSSNSADSEPSSPAPVDQLPTPDPISPPVAPDQCPTSPNTLQTGCSGLSATPHAILPNLAFVMVAWRMPETLSLMIPSGISLPSTAPSG
jgi:hypothetical protein